METVNIYDAKTRLSQLVDKAASGEDVVVSRNGKPLVRITRLGDIQAPHQVRRTERQAEDPADFDAPLPDEVLASFEGRSCRILLDTHIFLWAVTVSSLKPGCATPHRRGRRGVRVGSFHMEVAIKVAWGRSKLTCTSWSRLSTPAASWSLQSVQRTLPGLRNSRSTTTILSIVC